MQTDINTSGNKWNLNHEIAMLITLTLEKACYTHAHTHTDTMHNHCTPCMSYNGTHASGIKAEENNKMQSKSAQRSSRIPKPRIAPKGCASSPRIYWGEAGGRITLYDPGARRERGGEGLQCVLGVFM